jgi:hypothetical protein
MTEQPDQAKNNVARATNPYASQDSHLRGVNVISRDHNKRPILQVHDVSFDLATVNLVAHFGHVDNLPYQDGNGMAIMNAVKSELRSLSTPHNNDTARIFRFAMDDEYAVQVPLQVKSAWKGVQGYLEEEHNSFPRMPDIEELVRRQPTDVSSMASQWAPSSVDPPQHFTTKTSFFHHPSHHASETYPISCFLACGRIDNDRLVGMVIDISTPKSLLTVFSIQFLQLFKERKCPIGLDCQFRRGET